MSNKAPKARNVEAWGNAPGDDELNASSEGAELIRFRQAGKTISRLQRFVSFS